MNHSVFIRRSLWIAALILAGGLSTFLRADDSLPPGGAAASKDFQAMANQLWYLEHYAEVLKDPDSVGVIAVVQVGEQMKGQSDDLKIDFYNKMLYQVRSRAVIRALRLELANLYKANNRPDKAMEELTQLMTEQQ